MEDGSIILLVVAVLMVVMSACFPAHQKPHSPRSDRVRLKSRADAGDRRSKLALDMSGNYDRLLSTILIGNNIVNNVATTVGAVLFIGWLGDAIRPDRIYYRAYRGHLNFWGDLPEEPCQRVSRGVRPLPRLFSGFCCLCSHL